MAKQKSGSTPWLTLISSGLGVAIFSFVANKAWDAWSHRATGPATVQTSLRFEDSRLLLFVRNNGDEPLDLVRARIDIDEPALVSQTVLGAYPEVSKVYSVSASASGAAARGSVSVAATAGSGLVLDARIVQAIAPKGTDQFGFALDGIAGPIDLSRLKLRVQLEDIRGRHYSVTP
jgi:hypothetical protein